MSDAPEIILIAAVANNGIIGRNGALPFDLPTDLSRFARLTRGKTVVMGRRTFESIGKALPKRRNLVLSRSVDRVEGAEVVRSADEAIRSAHADELWVLGGEAVYRDFLPIADRLELTHVGASVEGDARFPEFDRSAFEVAAEVAHPADERHAHPFTFTTYLRRRGASAT